MTRVAFCFARPCAPNPAVQITSMPCFLCPGVVTAP